MKKFLVLIIGVLMSVAVFAHAPLISVDDNGDGTVYIEGGFSNGASAEGVEIIVVKDKAYNGPEETFKGKEPINKYCNRYNRIIKIDIEGMNKYFWDYLYTSIKWIYRYRY